LDCLRFDLPVDFIEGDAAGATAECAAITVDLTATARKT